MTLRSTGRVSVGSDLVFARFLNIIEKSGDSGFVFSFHILPLLLRLDRISDPLVMRQISEPFKDHPALVARLDNPFIHDGDSDGPFPTSTSQDTATHGAALKHLSYPVTAVTTSINDLPNEILSHIFDIGSLFDSVPAVENCRVRNDSIRSASQVCWRWYQRTCALGNPHFWATALSLALGDGRDPGDAQLARFTHSLTNSEDSDLSVDIVDYRTGSPTIASVQDLETRLSLYGLSALLPHKHHIWRLRLVM